ncbi:uncharacterized protein LOC127529975 [Erpetoichthys calabaricus]|uniref:uncharacterized protein LOC127529975 n=1 Tax=Erpetoichthys calabaricus TaxID=27687 RepID=UPI0022343120|nr:uncharacterized protein LOC127529975 [Erpetoichthys calabaricus]
MVDGVNRYATPLLRKKDMPCLQAYQEAVMPSLRSIERRLSKDSTKAAAYNEEIKKLEEAGYVIKLPAETITSSEESWFIPHHLVQHNGKNRVVFNCSFKYHGHSLNEYLLPGPALSPSLLGVLLRFREHPVVVGSDIRGMFHQIRLLPEDKPLLRFVWRNLESSISPLIYEWQVLPFGTTCSPCCAIFALQRHVMDNTESGDEIRSLVERNFYVDNYLQSLPSTPRAKQLIDKLRDLLSNGGFDLRQWTSNFPKILEHLPQEARSISTELWLSQDRSDSTESTLGLKWHCSSDTFKYKSHPVQKTTVTMRHIYRILASQYDPLGYILPFTTCAKVLVQKLWDKQRDWDDPMLPEDLLRAWNEWEGELHALDNVSIPRCYTPVDMDLFPINRQIHIFCDASEQAYGSVSFLRTEDKDDNIHLTFIMARSRVAPKRRQTIPRLELCAALNGAQVAKLLENELTLTINQVVLWSDSTTVLSWLQSESCRFKVFVGTRIAEIQELTDRHSWRYVDSNRNPADDITQGRTLAELSVPHRWNQGPLFLFKPESEWPVRPNITGPEVEAEQRKSVFCGSTVTSHLIPNPKEYHTWMELVEAVVQSRSDQTIPTAEDYRMSEFLIFQNSQLDSFPEEYMLLKNGKPVPVTSRLLTLAPEFDTSCQLIRVGGRLCRIEEIEQSSIHPIVLDPHHPVTKLIIQEYDAKLHHPGPERVFAELRRNVWILRGREAVRKFQHTCTDCRKQKAKPLIPKMADLPLARLRLQKPAFFSTGMDCFGPFQVKIGRRCEKRWGIIFKCLTTRCVHLDVLNSIDTDSFLMALRRFIARRGTPYELLSDQGTNFHGGERELRETFSTLSSELQKLLAKQKINFRFNPPGAPHFGGAWEREIRSVKQALYTTIGSQSVSEEVLKTVLIEIEGILNSKPLGYVSSNIADLDPVTPNFLLMGRPDSSLPQVVYPVNELMGRRRWRQSQVLTEQFWSSFVKYYLPSLQARQKWHKEPENLLEGMVVMLIDPQLPRALWLIGRIVRTFPSPDGHVRAVEVKVKDRLYTRPVARLIPLPDIQHQDSDINKS